MSQVLKFSQIRQLKVERIDEEPSVDRCWKDDNPAEDH